MKRAINTLLLLLLYTFPPLESKQQPLGALIFDCDGVLIDSEHAKFLAWKKALEDYKVDYSLDDYLPVVGHTSEYIAKNIKAIKNISLKNDFIATKNSYYKQLQSKGLPAFSQAVSFIKALLPFKKHNIVFALASSAPRTEIEHNIRTLGLEGIFDAIVSGEDDLKNYSDSEGTNKPKPYVYQETAKRLNIEPQQCIVFEDTNAGVEAAYSAGMSAIAVPNAYTKHHDFSHALFILPSFKLLEKTIKEAQESKKFSTAHIMTSKLKNLFGK